MEKPKSITQLSKEQLEDMCLNLMHADKVKTEMINQLETNIDEAIKLMRKKSKLVKKKELCHVAFYDMQMDDVSEVLEILERGKE